jgi:membrane-associated protein
VADPFPLVRDMTDALGAWTYVLVAAVVILETSVGLGLVSPGEAVLAVAGAAASVGTLELAVLLAVVCTTGVIGDTCSFLLGRRFGRVPQRAERVVEMYARRGGWILIAGRFVGPVRVFAPFVAGTAGMSYAKFMRFDVVGVSAWGSAYVLIGYAFAGSLQHASELLGIAGLGVFALGALIAALGARRASGPTRSRRSRTP